MYSEERRPWWFWLVLLGSLSTASLVGYLFLAGSSSSANPGSLPSWANASIVLLLPLFAWITTASRRYFVEYSGGQLVLGYPSWNVTLTPTEVLSARAIEIRWLAWGGFGWRLQGLKRIGYIAAKGSGVKLETHRDGRSYTFSCKDPDALLQALAADGVRVEDARPG